MLLVMAMAQSLDAARFVDAIVAQVDLHTITASDIGLARALGLYGLAPSKGPIRTADIDRLIDARLIIAESIRLNINPPAELVEKAWLEVANRRGGTEPFHEWLKQRGIAEAWARRMVSSDARRNYFVQLRFTRFVFIPEEEMTRALGSGRHGSEERERTRGALRQKQAEKDLARWLEEQRKRVKIRRFTDAEIPDPLARNASN